MSIFSRRGFMLGAVATGVAACDNSVGSNGAGVIDQRVQATLDYMYRTYPDTRALADNSAGMLVMPLVAEAGFFVGGSYGEGALLVNGVTVDHYSATQASVGLQIGAQQYAHTLFFMSPDALLRFRTSPGWSAGGDIEYVGGDYSGNIKADSTQSQSAVIALVFAQQGLRVGAALEGTKYTRILR
ncbi:YSC84-related protein [Qingshengfaniella alkalisoli]|uniref:Twin-arginine translocation pathway signal n=1 Tax=Qingshengfaniella alkalisoli TaxID=2599296 RepID=A0A5B8IS41_9RHOB|nr:YSC84-related protein [Qingshengfaniella alkalisoli]QDY69032.1 twin-arginine translocation pathway signal [Qingshengfaniella alkalisoli]